MPRNLNLLLFLFSLNFLLSQEKVTFSGYVSDLESNETLIGVSIIIPELNIGTITNDYGFYSLTIPKGNYTIQISYLGFEIKKIKLNLIKDLIGFRTYQFHH